MKGHGIEAVVFDHLRISMRRCHQGGLDGVKLTIALNHITLEPLTLFPSHCLEPGAVYIPSDRIR